MDNSFLVATGSADHSVYVYDATSGATGTAAGGARGGGGSAGANNSINAALLQKLEGHKDRVYAVEFHPCDYSLVSCSADNTIRVWTQ